MSPATGRRASALAGVFFLAFCAPFLFYSSKYLFYADFTVKEIYTLVCGAAAAAGLVFLREIRINFYSALILAFSAACLLSGAGNPETVFSLKAAKALMWLALAAAAVFIRSAAPGFSGKKFGTVMAAINALLCFLVFIQAYSFLRNPGQAGNVFGGRAFLPAGNPDILALLTVMSFPFLFEKAAGRLPALVAALLANAAAVAFTGSASGTAVFGLAAIYLLYKQFGIRKTVLIILPLAVIATGGAIISGKAASLLNEKKDSLEARVFLADASLRMAAQYPAAGVGAGNFRIFSPKYQAAALKTGRYSGAITTHDEAYVHNDFLQALAETGVPGAAVFAALVILPLLAGRSSPGLKAFFGSTVLLSLFNFPFSYPYTAAVFTVSAAIFAGGRSMVIRVEKPAARAVTAVAAACIIILMTVQAENIFAKAALTSKISNALRLGGQAAAKAAADSEKYRKYIESDYQLSFYYGTAMRSAGDTQKAVYFLENAARIFPYFEGTLFNLGNAYYSINMPDRAMDAYQRVIALNPKSIQALNNAGRCAIDMGKTADAVGLLNSALLLAPSMPEVNYNLAHAYFRDNNMTKAREYNDRALAADPEFRPALELRKEIR